MVLHETWVRLTPLIARRIWIGLPISFLFYVRFFFFHQSKSHAGVRGLVADVGWGFIPWLNLLFVKKNNYFPFFCAWCDSKKKKLANLLILFILYFGLLLFLSFCEECSWKMSFRSCFSTLCSVYLCLVSSLWYLMKIILRRIIIMPILFNSFSVASICLINRKRLILDESVILGWCGDPNPSLQRRFRMHALLPKYPILKRVDIMLNSLHDVMPLWFCKS